MSAEEIYCPSVDVCAWCSDSECGGISCIADLNPDDPDDHDAIERLHSWLRRGSLAEQMEAVLADAEHRLSATSQRRGSLSYLTGIRP